MCRFVDWYFMFCFYKVRSDKDGLQLSHFPKHLGNFVISPTGQKYFVNSLRKVIEEHYIEKSRKHYYRSLIINITVLILELIGS